jgi:DNA-directed RNA polymerase subunit RPC12/RpoP
MSRICVKCNEPTPDAYFQNSGTICDDCWHAHDLGRFEEAPPERGSVPVAPITRLSGGRFGIICPHCNWKGIRGPGYFPKNTQNVRCPHCIESYVVKLKEAK